MKLENQLILIDQAKKLKELGVAQLGVFSWLYSPSNEHYVISHQPVEALELLAQSNRKSREWQERIEKGIFSAFTCAELGIMLPDYITVDFYRMHMHEIKQDQNSKPAIFSVTIGKFEDHDVPTFTSECETFARCNLLIHLIENKFITVEEVNKRLIEN